METLTGIAGVASAIGASIALALLLEWLSLRGLMALMPRRSVRPEVQAGAIKT